MRTFKMTTICACLCTAMCGCSTLPRFSSIADRAELRPKVSDVVNEVQCEVLTAVKAAHDSFEAQARAGTTQPDYTNALNILTTGDFVMSVDLTLEVTNDQGVNPSLSFIRPFANSLSYSSVLGAQWSEEQHRLFDVAFTMVFSHNTPFPAACSALLSEADRRGLRGTLGIGEALVAGLPYTTNDDNHAAWRAYMMPVIGVTETLSNDPLSDAPDVPNFSSTIDFTVAYGLDGGPNWTLNRFAGPSSDGLVTAKRTNKDTLTFAVARVPPASAAATAASAAAAVARATATTAKSTQNSVTRLRLQQLLTH